MLSSAKHFNSASDHTILAMITSAVHTEWSLDVEIIDFKSCGLSKPSLIRFKLFTLDNRIIKAKIGRLSAKDQHTLQETVSLGFEDLIMLQ